MATSIYGCTAATYIFVLVYTSLNGVQARSHHTHLHGLISPHIHLDLGKASIPHLLHQSWKENQLPSAAHELWRQSWKQQNPSWRLIHWTDEDNRALVENHYPWLLDIYDKLWGVYRADLLRPLYMHLYGGVYADLDFAALRPFQQMFELDPEANIILGKDCGSEVDRSKDAQICPDYDQSIPNAFMASKPGHPFWNYVVQHVIKELWREGVHADVGSPESVTGPRPLFLAVQQYNEHAKSQNLDSDICIFGDEVYPVSWTEHEIMGGCCFSQDNGTFHADCCRERFPNAYLITFWTALWG